MNLFSQLVLFILSPLRKCVFLAHLLVYGDSSLLTIHKTFDKPTDNVTENSPLESFDWLVDVRHLRSFVITSFGLSEMGASQKLIGAMKTGKENLTWESSVGDELPQRKIVKFNATKKKKKVQYYTKKRTDCETETLLITHNKQKKRESDK